MTRRKGRSLRHPRMRVYVYTRARQINEAGRESDTVTERRAAPMQTESDGERDAFQSVIPYVIHRPDAQINAI